MSTPILNPNSSSTINANPNSNSSLSQIQIELGKILRQHDPNAIRLYDFLNHVKVFHYNSNEFRWENNSYIEGNLFAYEKQQMINNKKYSFFAFAVINREQHLIQDITSNMSEHADQQRLFYEIIRDNKCEVFCLHFSNVNECQRLHAFINRSIPIKEQQQSRAIVTGEVRPAQTNEQKLSVNVDQQSHLTIQQSIPVINGNSNTEDPTSSLKRLLNIPNPIGLNNHPQQQSITLLPPSAFHTISHERDTHPNREYIRNVLLDLIQNNDHFLDIIHQACYTYRSQ
jgi:hypothetical protein